MVTVTSPNSLPPLPCSLSHDSERPTRALSTRRPVPHRPGATHNISHTRTKPMHVSHTGRRHVRFALVLVFATKKDRGPHVSPRSRTFSLGTGSYRALNLRKNRPPPSNAKAPMMIMMIAHTGNPPPSSSVTPGPTVGVASGMASRRRFPA